MKHYFIWILLIWMSFTTSMLVGQEAASFRYLTKKDGLSQASVFSIAQDSAGFLWFGTKDGLNKFDGYQFKIYKKRDAANSLVANDIRTLYADKQANALWIGTTAGLSKYNITTDKFTNYYHLPTDSSSLFQNVIRVVFKDSKGRLWIGTSSGLNMYQPDSDDFLRLDLGESQDVKAIAEDADGQLWLGTENGLFRLKEKGDSWHFDIVLSNIKVKALLLGSEHNLWIGTYADGLRYWNRKSDVIEIYQSDKNNPHSLSHNSIRSMCLDKKGNLWVGTFDGLNYFDKKEKTFSQYKKAKIGAAGLSDKSVHTVFIDQQESLWVGTYYGGINHLDEDYNQFINFRHGPFDNALSADVVSSFAEDEKGNLWIGTEGGGLNFYDVVKKEFTSYQHLPKQKNVLSGNNVKQILLDENQLWVGTFRAGLNLFDLETKVFKHFKHNPADTNSLSNDNVYGLRKAGNLLWILTYGGGLDILDIEKNHFIHYGNRRRTESILSSNLTRVFLETKDKQVWIGTEKGLNKVKVNDEGFPIAADIFLATEKIYSLQEDSQHNIWVGTFSNGLYRLNPENGELVHFTKADGLPGNTVFGILETNDNELWLSTNNGLSKFNPIQKKFTNYSYSNGLENSEYNFNAYYKMKGGDLLFGGIDGFTRFNPAHIQSNTYIPPLVFTALKVNNKVLEVDAEESGLQESIDQTDEIIFKYNEASFSIGFAALDFFSPDNNHYAFKLEGLDNDWNYTQGETEATYTIQRDGEYIFRLKGANSDGIWNPAERQLRIIVLSPPWRSWWAYVLYAVFFGGMILGLVRFIRLRHKLQLEQIAMHQQEELHEVKMRFFTNITHEFRTPLTLILGPLKELINKEQHSGKGKRQLSLIERNAQRLLNLVNQILTFRRLAADHEPLKVVNGNIIPFLEEIFLLFKETANLQKINYVFLPEQPEIMVWYDQNKLEQVFFNLLSNAFKFTPDGGTVEMRISQKEQEYFEVKIRDTGPGIDSVAMDLIFKRFYEKQGTQKRAKGTGIGLAISKQMVDLHRGLFFVEKKYKKGAEFIVQIPLGKQHFKVEEISKGDVDNEKILDYSPLVDVAPALPMPNKKITTVSAEAPLLLVVEDNIDIQEYILQLFSDEYRLITAADGVEGLEKAEKESPDLIISDVMMPRMDGISFCEKLKTNLAISHIPIILLTARTASVFKIEGLKIGADDYITKPFNPEELRLRVRNLIQVRQEIRDRFSRTLSFNPREISVTSADETFLENAMETVEKNIENWNFNVLDFASELAVSRALLFTKLKALTGETPNNFIKTIRLKRAAQLLQTQKLNISEVTYKVGFKDPKYFRKCFQKQFGVLPSVFIKSGKLDI